MSRRLQEFAKRNLYKPGERTPTIGKPFVLKNKVGENSLSKDESACVAEMSILLDCWKTNNFSDVSCASQIQKFQTCLAQAKTNKSERSERMTSKQATDMLRRNPLPRS